MGSVYSAMVEKLEEIYRTWEIDLEPPPRGPMGGAIRQPDGSGLIRYRFAEDDRGPYLEYYSFHRIWGDSHVRINESGEMEYLDTLATTTIVTGDPETDRQQKERLHERNQRLLEELERAGLLSGGPVPGSFVINSAIVSGAVDPDAPQRPT